MADLPSGTVTLLFTDIEGSTRLVQRLGDAYADTLARHQHLLRAAFAAHDGRVVDTQGDSFFVAFPRAAGAVSAAVEAQRAIAAHHWPEGATLRVRMGIHTGEPLRVNDGYVGIDVHRGARVCAAGHGGQVLLTRATADLVRHRLPPATGLRDLGAHRLKDLAQPEEIAQLVVADLPADFPPLRTLDSRPHNLPARRSSLVGRVRDVAAARDLLRQDSTALLTLTGPDGVGKTRLMLEIGAAMLDEMADGVYLITPPAGAATEALLTGIAVPLGVRETRGMPLMSSLRDALHDRHLLLLIDGLERAADGSRALAELLITCPRLKIVITARIPLHLRGERELPVSPLSLPDLARLPQAGGLARYAAVDLFVQRSVEAKADFSLTDESAATVAELCVRAGGLPLSIELVAARMRQLPPRTILARLERRMGTLPGSAEPSHVARSRALRDVIAWSYHLLPLTEQTLMRRLAVFHGGLTAAAAESVCNSAGDLGPDVRRGLTLLVEAGLLAQEDTARGEARYVMPEPVRAYAAERLAGSGEGAVAGCRHASFYLAMAEAPGPAPGVDEREWLGRLDVERANLRAALAWSLAQPDDTALRLATALVPHWRAHGHLGEGRAWLEAALARAAEGVSGAVRAGALAAAGLLAREQGEDATARERLEASVALWREAGDAAGLGRALETLASVAAQQGRFDDARAFAEESISRARAAEDSATVARSLAWLGRAALELGDYAAARARLGETLALYRELADTRGLAEPLTLLGMLTALEGDRAGGRALIQEGLALLREADDAPAATAALGCLARLAWMEGDAAQMTERAEEWLRLSSRAHDHDAVRRAVMILGMAARLRGDAERAEARFAECLSLCRPGDDLLAVAGSLAGLAGLAEDAGDEEQAARLYGAAQMLLESEGERLSPSDRIDRERIAALARAGRTAHGRTPAWAQGHALTPAQAIAEGQRA